jgi:anti-sigma B factor antagonist
MGVGEHLQIDVRQTADRVVLSVEGELDIANAPLLETAIDEADLDARALVVFDLERLEFMDSTGLRIFISTREACEERGQQFAVTPGSEQVQRLLSITGAAEHLRTIATVDEALL